jgi:hypothetical protein
MTNIQQRRRLAEDETATPPNVTDREGYWKAGAKLRMGGVTYPRGSTVPQEIVAVLAPGRLSVLTGNKMLLHRLGVLDQNAPAAVVEVPTLHEAERKAMIAAMKANGYSNYELDHRERPTAGAYLTTHPSVAIKPGGNRGA